MSNLEAFMAQNAIKVENKRIVVSERFIDENGEPMKWEIHSITKQEDDALRKDCTKRIPVKGRKGMYTPELDTNAYLSKLAVSCTSFPDLNNKELQDSYGVMGAEDLLNKMLLPGEFTDYMDVVQEINGFDDTMDDIVEDAKN
nr:phage portal protein [uncultured Anaerostipes sp.]